jgi:uncharacterized protein YqgC (DUF456 family)
MMYLWATILVVANTGWLFLVLLGLPGNWLMVGSTALVAWLYWDRGMINHWTLIALLAVAVIGEVLEFAAGAVGTKKAGGSRGGAFGALLGGVIGAGAGTFVIPVPIIGSLIGACGGAFCGALALELAGGRDIEPAVRSGLGAGVGRFFGTVAKLVVGIVIWTVAAVAAFWP